MTTRSLALAGLLVGCSQPTLAPSRTLLDDPMLAALPSGVTLIGGADMAALDDSWLADSFKERTGVSPTAAPQLVGADTASAERLVLGCGDHGCLALAEGELDGLDWCALADRHALDKPVDELRCSAPSEPGLDARLPGGEPLAMRQLSPTKLVFGDRAAVRSAYPLASSRNDTEGPAAFDPAVLEGLVPQGALWMVAHEPSRVALQAARRLEQNGSAQALDMALELRAAVDCCSDQLEDVVAVALAVDDQDGLRAVLRITCRDGWTARAVERTLDERLERALDEGAPPWLSALPSLELVRVGQVVELRGHGNQVDLDGLLRIQEVSP